MEARVTVMLLPSVMPLVRLLVALVVMHVYSTPSEVRMVTSFILAATIVPVILLELSAEFPERPVLTIVFPEAEKAELVPFVFVEAEAPLREAAGVSVGVSEAATVVSDGVGVIAIAVESSPFLPHPFKKREKILMHKRDATAIFFLFLMIYSLDHISLVLFLDIVSIIIVRKRICRK